MSNGIAERQKEFKNLCKLAAFSNVYDDAKNLVALQIFLSVFLIVAISFLSIALKDNYPWLSNLPPFFGIFIVIIDLIFINPKIADLKNEAVAIHEDFDCEVFNLAWNEIKLNRPKTDEITEHAHKTLKKDPELKTMDHKWYAIYVNKLPPLMGILACQRINCRWDSKLRSRFIYAIGLMTGTVFILLIIYACNSSMSVVQFFTNLLFPFLPLAIFTIRQYQDNSKSIRQSERLKNMIENIWDKFIENSAFENLDVVSRQIQDEIIEKRRNEPLIFTWFYNLFRNSQEENNEVATKHMVDDFNKRFEGNNNK